MIVFPAIDVVDGKVVRLRQGDFNDKKIYSDSPLATAQLFEAAGITNLHLVDLDGAKAGTVINWKTIETICTGTSLKVDVGGGIKSEATIASLLNLGVDKVNLGSVAVKNPELVIQWLTLFGSERIILSADVKKELIAIHGWAESSTLSIYELVDTLVPHGLKYVTCTDIETDGMLSGPNFNLYKTLMNRYPDLYWIASGGVSQLNDLIQLQEKNIYGAIVGKAIYEGRIELSELKTLR